jgi:exodeoxyribonuclease V alpha subunit
MSLGFDDIPLDDRLAGFAPLPRAVARLVLARGGGWALARLAARAAEQDLAGHSAVALEGEATSAVAASELVARPPDFDPARHLFVLDGDSFQIARNHVHERDIARLIARRLEPRPVRRPVEACDLAALFGRAPSAAEAGQAAAVSAIPGRRFAILTGGPGTGKTTTVVRMLLALIRDREAAVQTSPRIALAAPTGKAAQRLGAAFAEGRHAIAALPGLDADWRRALAALEAVEASTLHRLLGARRDGEFAYGPRERLPADLVVVDEASMVDLALMHALLGALADEATLLVVGDAEQLTSVATGSLLRDLVDALDARAPESVLRLTHGFRSRDALAPIHAACRAGDVAAFDRAVAAAGPEVAAVHATRDRAGLADRLRAWADALADALAAAGAFGTIAPDDREAVARALAAVRARQLLVAVHDGPAGTRHANRVIGERLSQRAGDPGAAWHRGRLVIVTRNDPVTGLLNGDVGLTLRAPSGKRYLAFGSPTAPRILEPWRLPDHEAAYAITVHKSQGSEYDRVALLLPDRIARPDPGILSRQLVYTALTRARHAIEVWAEPGTLAAALGRPAERATTLARRLRAAP